MAELVENKQTKKNKQTKRRGLGEDISRKKKKLRAFNKGRAVTVLQKCALNTPRPVFSFNACRNLTAKFVRKMAIFTADINYCVMERQ